MLFLLEHGLPDVVVRDACVVGGTEEGSVLHRCAALAELLGGGRSCRLCDIELASETSASGVGHDTGDLV